MKVTSPKTKGIYNIRADHNIRVLFNIRGTIKNHQGMIFYRLNRLSSLYDEFDAFWLDFLSKYFSNIIRWKQRICWIGNKKISSRFTSRNAPRGWWKWEWTCSCAAAHEYCCRWTTWNNLSKLCQVCCKMLAIMFCGCNRALFCAAFINRENNVFRFKGGFSFRHTAIKFSIPTAGLITCAHCYSLIFFI